MKEKKLNTIVKLLMVFIFIIPIYLFFQFQSGCNSNCFEPKRTDLIPKDAEWHGGCDGGHWIEIIHDKDYGKTRIWRFKIFEYRGDNNPPLFLVDAKFWWNDKYQKMELSNYDAIHKLISYYDGRDIVLNVRDSTNSTILLDKTFPIIGGKEYDDVMYDNITNEYCIENTVIIDTLNYYTKKYKGKMVSQFLENLIKKYGKYFRYKYMFAPAGKSESMLPDPYLKGCFVFFNLPNDSILITKIDIGLGKFKYLPNHPLYHMDYYGQREDSLNFDLFCKEKINHLKFQKISKKQLELSDSASRDFFRSGIILLDD